MLKLTRRTDKKTGKKAGNFYIRGTVQGQSIFESTGTSHRPTAEALCLRRETEIRDRGSLGKAATLTFAEATLTYMETGGESRFIKLILEYAGPDTLLTEIDNDWINNAAAELYPNAVSATVNRQLITPVSAIYNLASDGGLAPYRRFKRRKVKKTGLRWLTAEEAELLLSNCDDHLKPIATFLLGTGARTSEALSIEAPFFYPKTGEVYLPDVKNEHPRMLQMPRRALDTLLATRPPEVGRIFLTVKGTPYKIYEGHGGQLRRRFTEAVKKSGLDVKGPHKVTPHTLRHTWATWFYSMTKDFGGLIDLGGWEKSDMANHYRKMAPADLPDRLLAHGWDFTALGTNLNATTASKKTAHRFKTL